MLPNPRSSSFPAQLRRFRKEAGLTLTQLADEAGISYVMPGRYERGESVPSMPTWQALNKALFKDIDEEEIEAEAAKQADLTLKAATVEEILQELKTRGFESVSLRYRD
ncbi:helix-turn-helix domain-containing protein [Metapseudomonas otitidis]|uniref:helix-turn-helix domain-containing protein n=1 Tax=Metapseudomonas otitidis TaxID=319939 RepID=UPI001F46F161|nr:helix-turn-helix transcriptional regulator [Pseudomonas otitidis]